MRKCEPKSSPEQDDLTELDKCRLGKGLSLSNTNELEHQYRDQGPDGVDQYPFPFQDRRDVLF